MPEPRSLAEFLGVADPRKPDEPPSAPLPATVNAKEFAKGVVLSRQYCESVMRRIIVDSLPPAVEVWLLSTAWGKPVNRVEFTDKTAQPLEEWTAEQLETRALFLANVARQMRERDGDQAPPTSEAVH